MMKKVTYLLTMIFAVALLSTSCCKDDPVPDPDEITTTDLTGNWDFQSLEFNGEITYDCDETLNETYDLVKLHLHNVTELEMTLYSDCMDAEDGVDSWSDTYDYTLDDNVIELGNNKPKFRIVNVDEFLNNLNILKLELFDQGIQTALPEGGIYTLTLSN